MTDLLALAERCEREKPSPDLDEAIWHALYPKSDPTSWPDYTSSIDDAATLVPADCVWGVDIFAGASARVIGGSIDDAFNTYSDVATTKTPALALCAAALRARAIISSRQAA